MEFNARQPTEEEERAIKDALSKKGVKEAFGKGKDDALAALRAQEQKLPLVWELKYQNSPPSYPVGTKHNEPKIYDADIKRKLEGIEYTLFEVDPSNGPSPEEMRTRANDHAMRDNLRSITLL